MKSIIALIAAAACFSIALPVQAGGISNELLLSSAWCTFTYNKTTGYSNTTRVRFNKNGTYGTGGRAEGSTSGKYGSYSSQNDTSGGGRWKVNKGELYISQGRSELAHVNTVVKRNSSGYPIILADGVEYSQCK
ncbi:MAG: hypothetical protein AABZ15_14200 [Nitrospirota bacterium]